MTPAPGPPAPATPAPGPPAPATPAPATPRIACLVPAAGLGERLGPGRPKALRELAGEPLLVHAVRSLRAVDAIGPVVVAAPAQDVTAVAELLVELDVVVVAGGATRQESVRLALSQLAADIDLVLVHDAARCLVPAVVVSAVVDALLAGAQAVVPVVALSDTVKQVAGDRVVATVDRSLLRAVQTPQGFRREVLERAHAPAPAGDAAPAGMTDDAGLVELLGGSVTTVPGHEEAFKITRPLDLLLAEAVLAARPARTVPPAPPRPAPEGHRNA